MDTTKTNLSVLPGLLPTVAAGADTLAGAIARVRGSTTSTAYYNEVYKKPDALRASRGGYRWLMRGLIGAVLRKAGRDRKDVALDIGCGQGHFTQLLAEKLDWARGIDISEVGIKTAREQRSRGMRCDFVVNDALAYAGPRTNIVFCRSLSLYNDASFGAAGLADSTSGYTRKLTNYIRPGGCLLWLYPSNLRPQSGQDWRSHTLAEVRAHFAPYNPQVYFVTRLETLLLGKWALSPFSTWLAQLGAKIAGGRVRGEIVVIARKAWGYSVDDRQPVSASSGLRATGADAPWGMLSPKRQGPQFADKWAVFARRLASEYDSGGKNRHRVNVLRQILITTLVLALSPILLCLVSIYLMICRSAGPDLRASRPRLQFRL